MMKIVLFLVAVVSATTFFAEDFSSGWEKRWVQSTHKPEAERGELLADETGGVKTATDARFYQYSAKIAPFSNVSKKQKKEKKRKKTKKKKENCVVCLCFRCRHV